LEELHEQLWSCAENDVTFKELGLYTHRAASRRLGLVAGPGQGSVAREAMAVAESFIVQMRIRLRGTSGASESPAGGAVVAPSALALCEETAVVADAGKNNKEEGATQRPPPPRWRMRAWARLSLAKLPSSRRTAMRRAAAVWPSCQQRPGPSGRGLRMREPA
jgi:hypothetical protein